MKYDDDDSSFHKGVAAKIEPAGAILQQHGSMFNWNSAGKGGCCGMSMAFRLVLSGSIGSFLFGINLSLLNTCLKTIKSEYRWCGAENVIACDTADWYGAIMSTVVFIGAAIGSISSGRFLVIGRRMLMLLCQAIFTFGVVSSVVANSFPALLWARFVVGFGVGIMSVAPPTWMAEMAPANKRGTYGVMHQLMITVGIFVGVLIGLPLHGIEEKQMGWELPMFDKIWWRVMLGLGIVPVVVGVYCGLFVHNFETPHWYAEQRRYKDCEEILKRVYDKEDVSVELEQVISSLQEAEVARKNGMSLGKAMSMSEYRYVIIVGCLLSGFQQLGGINVFIASSNDLFGRAGLNPTMQTVASTLMTLINCLMTIPTMFLIERMGRKTLLLIGAIMQTAFMVPATVSYWTEADYENPGNVTMILAIVGVFGFVVFFATAYGPVLWVYLFEIYSADVKDVASSLATMVNWICGIIMVFCGNLIPNHIAYTIFTVMCGISAVLIGMMARETKGRPLGDSPFFTKNYNTV